MTRIPSTSSHVNVPQRIYWIGYLRTINILGTVVVHSFLAYSPFVQKLSFGLLIAPSHLLIGMPRFHSLRLWPALFGHQCLAGDLHLAAAHRCGDPPFLDCRVELG
jgi:hypothetical protein